MRTLQEIWAELSQAGYETDKGSVHSYLSVYEEILAPYRETAQNVLEIGLFKGHSMRMWEQYFTNAKVYGIDCHEQPHGGLADLRPMIKEGGHNIIIGDATSQKDIESNFKGMKFDVVLDDGNHDIEAQLETFFLLKTYMNPGGLFLIEDIQDIDAKRWILENIYPQGNVEIIDRRKIKGRYDDVVVAIKFNQ